MSKLSPSKAWGFGLSFVLVACMGFVCGGLWGVRRVSALAAEHLVRVIYAADGRPIGQPTLIDHQAVAQLAAWRQRFGPVKSYKIDFISQGPFGIPTRTFLTVRRGVTIQHEVVQGDGLCYVSDVELDHG